MLRWLYFCKSFHPHSRRLFSKKTSRWGSVFHSSLPDSIWNLAQEQKLRREEIDAHFAENLSQLSHTEIAKLSQELSRVAPVAAALTRIEDLITELAGVQEMVKELAQEKDRSMVQVAQDEMKQIENKLAEEEENLLEGVLPVDEDDDRNAVLEVRAGTGGEEAALFAMDLFNMYEKFAKIMGWRFRVIDVSLGEAGRSEEQRLNSSH